MEAFLSNPGGDGSRIEKRWKIRYIRSRSGWQVAASFSSVGRFNRVGPLFRFVPFHISLLLFSLPVSFSSKLNPNFPGPSFSPPSPLSLSNRCTPVFSLPRKIRPLSSVNSFDFYLGRWFSGSSVPRFEDFINIKPRGGEERFFDPPLLYRLFFSFGTDRAVGHLSIESSKFSRVDRIVFIHDFGQFSISSLLSYADFFAKFSFCSGVFISASEFRSTSFLLFSFSFLISFRFTSKRWRAITKIPSD